MRIQDWKDREIEQWQSKQRPLGDSCEIRESEHDNSWCDIRGLFPLVKPPPHSPWVTGVRSQSQQVRRQTLWLYIQRGPQYVGTVCIHFRFTDRVLPSMSLRPCSTEIMQHWHPDNPEDGLVKATKHIDTASTLANWAISCVQNHPCDVTMRREGAPPPATFAERYRQ